MQVEKPPAAKRPATSTSDSAIPAKTKPGLIQSNIVSSSDDMGLTGTGQEIANGGGDSYGSEVYYIERPLTIFGRKETVYKKCHKFMTFGFATAHIIEPIGSVNVFQTSYLAEIPWHVPALYLNECEFNLIPIGSHVKEVTVQVIYRGSTIQFETNSSATGLATLNQINNIGVAEGLNLTGWGSNVSFKGFNSSQSMIPEGIRRPVYGSVAGQYRGMMRDYYGSNQGSTVFLGDIPKHQVGGQTFLYNYWANTSTNNIIGTGTTGQKGGWPCLNEKVTSMDGKTCINQVVLETSYKPKVAPLKTPLKAIGHGLPFTQATGSTAATLNVPCGGQLTHGRVAAIAALATASDGIPVSQVVNENENGASNAITTEFSLFSPIEKSQYWREGFWSGIQPQAQPSVHIGVQPVPALSSAALLTEDNQFNQWTDTRGYWEVNVTMTVVETLPTAYPYGTIPNVPWGDVMMETIQKPAIATNLQSDGATFCGLYTQGYAIAPPPAAPTKK